VVILGSYGIRVLNKGKVAVAGATLYASDHLHWLHAPHCHAIPVIRCLEEAAVELAHHPAAQNLRDLDRLSPTFAKLWNEPGSSSLSESTGKKHSAPTYQIVGLSILSLAESESSACRRGLLTRAHQIYDASDGPKKALLQELTVSAEWNKKMADIGQSLDVNSSSIFVCGPKSCGKSTFSRVLGNQLITSRTRVRSKAWPGVVILDIDPGQPEFATPGVISVVHISEPNLSPPFCHPYLNKGAKGVLRSHALGSITPAADPQHYMACVMDLYATYQRTLRGVCPLIINTPGWVQGTGLDILTELVTKLRPTEIVYMSVEGPEDTVESLQSAAKNASVTQLPSQASEFTSRTALHLRTMQTMSYFHLDVPSSPAEGHLQIRRDAPPVPHDSSSTQARSSPQLQWNAKPITCYPPWLVRYGGPRPGILAIVCYDYQPPLDLLVEALNGSVVSIVEIESREAFRSFRAPRPEVQDDDAMALDGDDENSSDDQDTPNAEAAGIDPELIVASPEGIPLLRNPDGKTLDSKHSQFVGTALIRGIDVTRGELQLLCPLAVNTVDRIIRNGRELVLVAGKLDPPTWAYTEDLYYRADEASAAKSDAGADDSVEVTDEDTDDDKSDVQEEQLAEPAGRSGIPWVETLYGSEKRAVGSRVWRVRRDLGKGGNATD